MRSIKKHLYQTIRDTKLIFEDFSAVSAIIEGCLNSRPLIPMSSDESDFSALTPGLFLIESSRQMKKQDQEIDGTY